MRRGSGLRRGGGIISPGGPVIFPAGTAFLTPIIASPVLDPSSATVAAALAAGSHVVDTIAFGVPFYTADASTPRYSLTITEEGAGAWGDNDLAHVLVPIPNGAVPASGSDAKMVIVDPTTNSVFDLYGTQQTGSGWQVTWGGVYPLNGDGSSRNPAYGTGPYGVTWMNPLSRGTGSGISSAQGMIRLSEIGAGNIPHALVFSTDIATGPAQTGPFRWPATTTDGAVLTGTTIDQGTRVQLDPSLNLSTISGITAGELAIGRALQLYGAYVTDNGGARMAFGAEMPEPGQTNTYPAAGMVGDYVDLPHLPWGSLRVLQNWDGSGSLPSALFAVNDSRHFNSANLLTSATVQAAVQAAGLPWVRTWAFNNDEDFSDGALASTTIAAGSNGAVLPQATINVASSTGFNAGGGYALIQIATGNGAATTVHYTGTAAGQLTGCTGGQGTLATGKTVTPAGLTVPGTGAGTVRSVTQPMLNARLAAVGTVAAYAMVQLYDIDTGVTGTGAAETPTHCAKQANWIAEFLRVFGLGGTVGSFPTIDPAHLWFEVGNEWSDGWTGQVFYDTNNLGANPAQWLYYNLWNAIVPAGSYVGLRTLFPNAKIGLCPNQTPYQVGTTGWFGAGGDPNARQNYLADVNTHASSLPDFVPFHLYVSPGAAQGSVAAWVTYLNAQLTLALSSTRSAVDSFTNLRGLPLALTEWGLTPSQLSAAWVTAAERSYMTMAMLEVGGTFQSLYQTYNLQFAAYFDLANQTGTNTIDLFLNAADIGWWNGAGGASNGMKAALVQNSTAWVKP